MKYNEINETLIDPSENETDNEPNEEIKNINRNYIKFTRKNVMIGGIISLIFLIISTVIIFNFIRSESSNNSTSITQSSKSSEDTKAPTQLKLRKNGTTIECQRTFYLFHQDQNHVCEVTNLVIKNDTNYTIIGNDLTNVLHIFNYEVYKLPKEIFSKFTSLKHLVVNANHLKILESDTFDDADKLEVLRFSNNDLEDVPSYVFKNMKSLKTLDLGRNKIESLHDDSFRGLGILERLYLSDNNLKIIPKKVFYPLRKIVTLSLENNQISELGDDTFRYNVAMRSLGLSNNTFSYLQTELFRYFLNLSDLSISDLRITTIDLNGTSTINTLVIRNTDLLNITMSNFPKILVSYGTNLEVMKFIVNKFTANFTRIPNWGGMYYNKNIRFIFFIEEDIATQENIEAYDIQMVRSHKFLSTLDYETSDWKKFIAVEYQPTRQD